MRWSPFLPLLSGVSPLPYFSHASMDLQMCMPRSLTMLVFTTLLPLAAIILARALPSRLLRTCPRWRGLLVLGDEYSIITRGDCGVAGVRPYCSWAWMSSSSSIQAAGATVRFRKPLMTLKAATAGSLPTRYAPISCAVCSGPLRDMRRKGNTTSVRCPSNSFFVFCNCTSLAGTSCP